MSNNEDTTALEPKHFKHLPEDQAPPPTPPPDSGASSDDSSDDSDFVPDDDDFESDSEASDASDASDYDSDDSDDDDEEYEDPQDKIVTRLSDLRTILFYGGVFMCAWAISLNATILAHAFIGLARH